MTLTEFIDKCKKERKVDNPHFILADQIREAGIPEPLVEEQIVKGRKFVSDLYWPGRLCIEIDGIYVFGKKGQSSRHLQPKEYTKDQFKALEIELQHGIPTHHFVPDAIYSNYAIWWLTLKLTGVDTGRPQYNPGIKSKKIKEKKSDNIKPRRTKRAAPFVGA